MTTVLPKFTVLCQGVVCRVELMFAGTLLAPGLSTRVYGSRPRLSIPLLLTRVPVVSTSPHHWSPPGASSEVPPGVSVSRTGRVVPGPTRSSHFGGAHSVRERTVVGSVGGAVSEVRCQRCGVRGTTKHQESGQLESRLVLLSDAA